MAVMGCYLWILRVRFAGIGSESLGPQQGVGQVKQQTCGDETGQRIVEDHDRSPQSRSQA